MFGMNVPSIVRYFGSQAVPPGTITLKNGGSTENTSGMLFVQTKPRTCLSVGYDTLQ